MLAGNLDRLAKLDATLVDLNAESGLDGLGNHGSGDRAEQLALFADLRDDAHGRTGKLLSELVRVSDTNLFALGDVVLTLLELLEVALGRADSVTLGEQVVVSKAGSHVDDVALAALALELLEQNNLHVSSLATVAAVAAAAHSGDGVGHQSHLASTLDSVRDVALMLGAGTRHATRLDLATISNIFTQHLSVFVIDILNVVFAELAILTTRLLSVIGHFNLFRFA